MTVRLPTYADPYSAPLKGPHPGKLEQAARARERKYREKTSSSLLNQMFKLSAARAVVGENAERWPEEAYDELLRQHPWSSKYTVKKCISASNDNGYAAGFFQITPREIPASVAGPSTVNVITVPIIVKDFELLPFDIFAYKGSFYPLNQERAERLLNLRDIFRESDRADFRDVLRNSDFRTLRDSWIGGNNYSAVKFAMPKDLTPLSWSKLLEPALKQSLDERHTNAIKQLRASVISEGTRKESLDRRRLLHEMYGSRVYRRLDQDGRMTYVEQEKTSSSRQGDKEAFLRSVQQPCAVILSSRETGLFGQLVFQSSPENGRVGFGERTKVSSYDVINSFGTEVLDHVLKSGEEVVSLNPATQYERSVLEKKAASEREKVSYMALRACSSDEQPKHYPAYLYTFIRNPESYDRIPNVSGAEPERFQGYIVNEFDSRRGFSGGAAGILTLSGSLILMDDFELQRAYLIVDTDIRKEPSDVKKLDAGRRPYMQQTNMAVWSDGTHLWCVRYGDDAVEVDGTTYRFGTNGLIDPNSTFKRLVQESVGDTQILHIPSSATLIEQSVVIKPGKLGSGDSSSLEPLTEAPASSEEVAEEVPEEGTEEVKVSFDNGLFRVYSDTLAAHTSLNDQPLQPAQTKVALSLLGASRPMVDGLMKIAQAEGLVACRLEKVELSQGQELLKQAEAKTESVEKMADALRPLCAEAVKCVSPLVYSMERARTKLSLSALDTSVDAALSLGFLNRRNLLKFLDLVPSLEESLSAVCALLVASRLGLDEVDEESLEGSIQSLERVLQGLRVVELALMR